MANHHRNGSGRRDFRVFLIAVIPTILLILFILGRAQAAEVGPVKTFCIQTMNMYGPAYASDRWLRFPVASDFFAKQECDVVNLQEVWNEGQYKKVIEGALNAWPEFHSRYFGRTKADPNGPRFGMATFTSHEILETKKQVFTVNYDMDTTLGSPIEATRELFDVKKGYGVVVVNMNGIYPIAFINTHLHPTSAKVRLAQTIELLQEIDNYLSKDIPVVLTGDLNTQPGSLELATLEYVGQAKDTLDWTSECTYCFWNSYSLKVAFMNDRMDYILLFDSRTYTLSKIASQISPKSHMGVTLSDHYGVEARIEVNKREKELVENTTDFTKIRAGLSVINKAILELQTMNEKEEFRTVLTKARKIQERLKRVRNGDEMIARLRR